MGSHARPTIPAGLTDLGAIRNIQDSQRGYDQELSDPNWNMSAGNNEPDNGRGGFKPSKETPAATIQALDNAVKRGTLSKDSSGWYVSAGNKEFPITEDFLTPYKGYIGKSSSDALKTIAMAAKGSKKFKKGPSAKYSKMKHKLGVKGKAKPGSLLSAYNGKKKSKYL